jgi:HEAT repeat protein
MLNNPVPVLADLSLQVVALQTIAELDAKNGLQALTQAVQPRPLPQDSAVALKIAEGFYRQRRAALNGLGATRTREAAAVLAGRAGLQDPDFRLRAVAVHALGRLGFSDIADKVRVALNDPAAEVRWTAAAVLGRMDNPKAVEPLMAGLTDSHAEVRRQAALSLGYLGARNASEALLRLRRDDDNAAVREAAAYSLWLIAK